MNLHFPLKRTGLTTICFGSFLILNTSKGALINIPGLYNTGVNDQGTALPITSQDPHYLLAGPEGQAFAYVQNPVVIPPAWATAPAGSAWIGPDPTGNNYPSVPPGDYYYAIVLTFVLKDVDVSKVQIAGFWATDNTGQILVNGQPTSFSKGLFGFTQLDPFLLQGMFVPGFNTLEFLVNNQSGPSGLLVAGLEASDDGNFTLPDPPPSAVPEPSTYIAGALLMLPFIGQGLKRLHRRSSAPGSEEFTGV